MLDEHRRCNLLEINFLLKKILQAEEMTCRPRMQKICYEFHPFQVSVLGQKRNSSKIICATNMHRKFKALRNEHLKSWNDGDFKD